MKISIKPEEINADDGKIGIKINSKVGVNVDNPNLNIIEIEMNMRNALNGDLMIFEHKDIDIVIMLEKKKIVAFAKELMSEMVYGAESRLMEHLRSTGIIEYDSIQGGNVYGSLEGKIHESKDRDSLKSTLYQVHRWLQSEAPYLEAVSGHDEQMGQALYNPNAENSTELGEVPHEEEKGGIRGYGLFSPYFYGRYTY